MPTVSIHPPKTPVTKGSNSVSAATLPNVCKMPGPPAPFVPTPLPNIGRSPLSPKGYSTSVKIEGNFVAIMGASFGSMGDIASKGTGGGILSMNVEGPTKFIAPGSLTVKIQGKNVHLLSDVMSNNNGPAGSPPNAATMMGTLHGPSLPPPLLEQEVVCAIHCCDKKPYKLPNNRGGRQTCQRLGSRKHSCVFHALQGKPGIQASPRKENVPGASRTLIPDVIVNDEIIDAKFPCDPAKVNFGSSVTNTSLSGVSGASMLKSKEKKEYKRITGVKDVSGMSPSDTNAQSGSCNC